MRIGTKLGQTGPKKAICCLKVPFFRSLPGVNGLKDLIDWDILLAKFGPTSIKYLLSVFAISCGTQQQSM